MDDAAGEGGASPNNKVAVAVMSVVVVSSSSVSSLCAARFVFLLAGSNISNVSNTDASADDDDALDEELRLDDLLDFFLDLEDLVVVDVPAFTSLRRYAIFLSLFQDFSRGG